MVETSAPLVIRLSDGAIRAVARINEKGYNKSIEERQLWHLHPATGRLLPYETKHQFVRIKKHSGWYEAYISIEESESTQTANCSTTHDLSTTSRQQEKGASERAEQTAEQHAEQDVLNQVAAVIAERHRTMPEGSYTSYLFSEGREKIRKKLAEEAVELALATEPAHMQSEGADLLYHFLVFLEFEGVELQSVLQELQDRL